MFHPDLSRKYSRQANRSARVPVKLEITTFRFRASLPPRAGFRLNRDLGPFG